MKVLHFTPLVVNHNPAFKSTVAVSSHKETEPKLKPADLSETTKPEPEEDILEEEKELFEGELGSEAIVIPDKPLIDQELQTMGVSTPSSNYILLGNKKIELPLSPAEVKIGETKPLTSGIRWIAELTKYILRKLHLTIKKVGQVLKYAPAN